MHSFKTPSLSVALKQTWTRTKTLIIFVFPIYILGSAVMQGLYAFGVLTPVNAILAPITVFWLGLPVITGVLFIFMIVRKEFTLLVLVAIFGTHLAGVLTPIQFIILALVGMLYTPCLSVLTKLAVDFNWRTSITIGVANFITAIVIGGVMYRIINPFF